MNIAYIFESKNRDFGYEMGEYKGRWVGFPPNTQS